MVIRRWTVVSVAALLSCAPPDNGATGPEWPRFEARGPEVRIGAVDDPDYAFGFVRALEVGPDGRIYSLHQNDAFVRRWTPEGRPDGQVGRAGEGPGEFQQPAALGFHGDSLWVVDFRGYTASFFGPDGSYLGRVRPEVDLGSREAGPGGAPPRPQEPLRDGRWYGVKPAFSHEIVTGVLSRIPHVLMDPSGAVVDTAWVQEYRPHDILGILNEDGRGGFYGRQPFGDGPLADLGRDGSLTVVERRAWSGEGPARVRVLRLALTGDTLFDTSLEYTPLPLPRERVDSAADAAAAGVHGFMSRMRPGLALGALQAQYREAVHAPPFVPPVRDMALGADGTVWLQQRHTDDGWDRWWVVDGDGHPAREVAVPRGIRIMAAEGDRVWGVETDELDVSYIVVFRLEPSPGE